MPTESKIKKPTLYSVSLPSGGILTGAITRILIEILQDRTGYALGYLFPGGVIASSVGSIPASHFLSHDLNGPKGHNYTDTQYGASFDAGANKLSPPNIQHPYIKRMIEESIGLGVAGATEMITLGAKGLYGLSDIFFDAARALPAPIITRAYAKHDHKIHMNTAEFDAFLKSQIGHLKLSDLHGSVIFTAGRVSENPKKQSAQFSRIERNDGSVDYSFTKTPDGQRISHADISLYDIVKACTAIPGVMDPHYIAELNETFYDNGHVHNAATHALRLAKQKSANTEFGCVMLGKARYPILTGIKGILAGIFTNSLKDMTCNQPFSDSIDTMSDEFRNRFVDFSFIFDNRYKTAGYTGRIPADDILRNTEKHRQDISDIVHFDLEVRRAEKMNRLVDRLATNADLVADLKRHGDFYVAAKGTAEKSSTIIMLPRQDNQPVLEGPIAAAGL